MVVGPWTTIRARDFFLASACVLEIPSRVSLHHCAISLLMTILARSWTYGYLFLSSHSKLLRFLIVTKFVVVVIGARASSRISLHVFSASLTAEIPSWTTLTCCSISILMLVLSWAGSKWNTHLTSESEFLCPRVVTKFVWVIISSRTTTRVTMYLNSTNCVFKVPGRVSLLHSPISLLVIVLTRSWTYGYLFLASDSELMSLRIVAKFVIIIVSSWTS